jgi:mannose-P-dolichol utilization defect protein 1
MARMSHVCAALAAAAAILATCALAEKKEGDELVLGLFTPQCFEAFVTHHDFANVACIKAVVSKGLSYAIITGSLILKLPQILKILGAKDVTGLTPSAFYMEAVLYLSSTIYNLLRGYPLSTWGENLVILAQNVLLVLLLWAFYTPKIPVATRFGLVLVFSAMAAGMLAIPDEYQWLLASAGIPVSIVARIPQVRRKSWCVVVL